MSFAKSQPLTPQPKSRLPERTMAPYSLKHLWTQQDKKLATSWQRAAGTWGNLISRSLSGEDKRGTDSGVHNGGAGFRTRDEGIPSHPGVSPKGATEARLRETLDSRVRLGKTAAQSNPRVGPTCIQYLPRHLEIAREVRQASSHWQPPHWDGRDCLRFSWIF